MVIHTTVTTLGLGCEVARSAFPSMFQSWDGRRHRQSYLREMEFAVNVEGCTESWRGRVCPEYQGRHIPLEGSVSRGVLWHPPWVMWVCIHISACIKITITLEWRDFEYVGANTFIMWPLLLWTPYFLSPFPSSDPPVISSVSLYASFASRLHFFALRPFLYITLTRSLESYL